MKRAGKLTFACSIVLATGTLVPVQAQTQGQSLPALGQPNPKAVSLYNLGLTAYKQGSPESAIIFFKRACDIDPDLADAQYNLGVIFQLQKRFKEAQPRFEEVLRIKPSDPDAHYQLGLILKEAGKSAEARQHLMAIAPNNNHYAEAQRSLAQLSNLGGDSQVVPDGGLRDGGFASSYGNQGVHGQMQPTPSSISQPSLPSQQNRYGVSNGGSYSTGQLPPQAMQIPQHEQLPPAFNPTTSSVTYGGSAASNATESVPSSSENKGPVPKTANASLRIIATGFSAPSGLAFDRGGNLYVANYMTNSIDRINQDGTRSTFCSGANIRGPIGLVVDENNNVYVANYNGGTVARISPAGVSLVIASGFKKPYYLTLDRDGNLYVSQQEDNSIVRITLPRAVGSK